MLEADLDSHTHVCKECGEGEEVEERPVVEREGERKVVELVLYAHHAVVMVLLPACAPKP